MKRDAGRLTDENQSFFISLSCGTTFAIPTTITFEAVVDSQHKISRPKLVPEAAPASALSSPESQLIPFSLYEISNSALPHTCF